MTRKDSTWFRVSGICGVLTPIVAFTCILLAIANCPPSSPFSWTNNALSDLGVIEGITKMVFNSGLIITGILSLMFTFGLYTLLKEKVTARIGISIFVLTALSLTAIGVFPENAKPMHFYASVAFFMLYPVSMFFLVTAFLQMAKVKMALFTFLMANAATAAWTIQATARFGSGVAIPETIAALSASTWSTVMGFKMLRHASRPSA
jgi:hypothetical membrane protein